MRYIVTFWGQEQEGEGEEEDDDVTSSCHS